MKGRILFICKSDMHVVLVPNNLYKPNGDSIKLYSHQMFFFRVDIDQFVHRNLLVLFNLITLRFIGPKSTLQINVLRVEAVVSYATIVALVTFQSRSIPFSEFLPSLRFLYICLYCHLYILWSSFGFTLYGDVWCNFLLTNFGSVSSSFYYFV